MEKPRKWALLITGPIHSIYKKIHHKCIVEVSCTWKMNGWLHMENEWSVLGGWSMPTISEIINLF